MAQTPVLCDLCNSSADVQYFCLNCEVTLCTRCNLIHSRLRKTQHDEVIPLSEASQERNKVLPVTHCGKHSIQEATLFCVKCTQTICTQCLSELHNTHSVKVLKDLQRTRIEDLTNLKIGLMEKKSAYEKAFDYENTLHNNYAHIAENCKHAISGQISDVIKELNAVRDEQFVKLSFFQNKEDKRYADACAKLQVHKETLVSTINEVDNAIKRCDPVQLEQATNEATNVLQNTDDPAQSFIVTPGFQRANINKQALCNHVGNLFECKQVSSRDNGAKIRRARIIYDIHVGDKTCNIRTIVPLADGAMWVAQAGDKHLLLIGQDGKPIKESLKLELEIIDAKQYDEDILITCRKGSKIIKLTEDGQTMNIFSNLAPFLTWKFCVTHDKHVLVCLTRTTAEKEGKVVRLKPDGEVIQSFQYDHTGAVLYTEPSCVTSLPSGEVVVADYIGQVICVDRDGRRLFAWKGNTAELKVDAFSPIYITHDVSNNLIISDFQNHRILLVGCDGKGPTRLVDRKDGLDFPVPVTVDNAGRLLVGCSGGKIHVIEY